MLSATTVSAITGEGFRRTGPLLSNNGKFHECGYASARHPADGFVITDLGADRTACNSAGGGSAVNNARALSAMTKAADRIYAAMAAATYTPPPS